MQIIYILVIIGSFASFSQTLPINSQDIEKSDSLKIRNIDSTKSKATITSIDSTANKSTFLGLKREDPTNAMICSIIPGGGQVYNRTYWKAGLLFGAGAALAANLIYNDNQLVETRQLISSGDFSGSTLDRLKLIKEDYQDTRDRMGFFILVLYIASTVDAYVGAKLSDFNVDDELSFYLDSDLTGVRAGIKLDFNSLFK